LDSGGAIDQKRSLCLVPSAALRKKPVPDRQKQVLGQPAVAIVVVATCHASGLSAWLESGATGGAVAGHAMTDAVAYLSRGDNWQPGRPIFVMRSGYDTDRIRRICNVRRASYRLGRSSFQPEEVGDAL